MKKFILIMAIAIIGMGTSSSAQSISKKALTDSLKHQQELLDKKDNDLKAAEKAKSDADKKTAAAEANVVAMRKALDDAIAANSKKVMANVDPKPLASVDEANQVSDSLTGKKIAANNAKKVAVKPKPFKKGTYLVNTIDSTATFVKSDSAEFAGMVPDGFKIHMKPR